MVDLCDISASLYIPASHPRLLRSLFEVNPPLARSLILCTEDSLAEAELPAALEVIRELLPQLTVRSSRSAIYLRPRNPAVLDDFLHMRGIEHVSGFVIPKADAITLPAYCDQLLGRSFRIMPVLETSSIFDDAGRIALREYLNASPLRRAILALRIGGNDLLRLLGLKRRPGISIYQTPLGTLIPQLVMCFRPHGYQLTGVVCDSLDDTELLQQEARQDALMGLIGKTAIHPQQIPIIEREFAISQADVSVAHEILKQSTSAVCAFERMMLEKIVHEEWARQTLQRASLQMMHEDPR